MFFFDSKMILKGLSFLTHQFDIFKSPFLLRIHSSEKISTLLGFFFSLGIIIFLGIFTVNSDVFHHQKPSIIDQQLFLPSKLHIDFNGDNFGLVAALIDDPGNVYYDETYFSISMTQFVINCSTHEIIDEDRKNMRPCDENDYEKNPSIVDIYGLRNYSCPSNKSFAVEGGWDEPIINYVYVTFALCNNESMNNTCKSFEDMIEFLSDKYVSISYIESSYDLNNYLNPLQNSYKNLWWTVGANVRKTMSLYWKKVEIVTDDGFVFQQSKLDQSFQKDEGAFDVDLNYNQFIFQAEFYSSPKKQYATRTYQKIQEVIASIGGLLSLFVAIGFVLTGPQTRLNVIKTIMNDLYVFHKRESNKKRRDQSKITTLQNIIINNEDIKSKIESSLSLENEEKVEKSPKKKREGHSIFKKTESAKINVNDPFKRGSQTTRDREQKSAKIKKNQRNNSHDTKEKQLKDDSFVLDHYSREELETAHKYQNFGNEIIKQNIDLKKDITNLEILEKLKVSPKERTQRTKNTETNRNFLNEKVGSNNPIVTSEQLILNASSKWKLGSMWSKIRSKTNLNPKKQEKILEFEKYLKEKKNEFTFSLFEYFKYSLKKIFGFKLSFKEKLFKNTEKAFNKEVDLISILQRIHEINKLKLILMNTRQMTLFNLLSKPMIIVNPSKLKNAKKETSPDIEKDPSFLMSSLIMKGRKSRITHDSILECYKETFKEQHKNPLDARLLHFMDEKLHMDA